MSRKYLYNAQSTCGTTWKAALGRTEAVDNSPNASIDAHKDPGIEFLAALWCSLEALDLDSTISKVSLMALSSRAKQSVDTATAIVRSNQAAAKELGN